MTIKDFKTPKNSGYSVTRDIDSRVSITSVNPNNPSEQARFSIELFHQSGSGMVPIFTRDVIEPIPPSMAVAA